MPIKFKYPVCVVVWGDAESDASWSEVPATPLKATTAVTLGYLIVDEKDYIMVADSYFQDSHSKTISNTTKIPRGMIIDLMYVTVNEKKKKKELKPIETIEAAKES